jgi:prephenate dehydratase
LYLLLLSSGNYTVFLRAGAEFATIQFGGRIRMPELNFNSMRVAFQGEPGAFSEAAAVKLLGGGIQTIPRTTFDSTFRAISEGAADALLVPVENTLAGSVVRVYDLLLESPLEICGETILPIEHHLLGQPSAKLGELRSVASHPMALAQCERFFESHPTLKRVPAEDTAGSVREMMGRNDPSFAAIAGRTAAQRYGAVILQENIQDNAENFTRFVLLLPHTSAESYRASGARKMSLAIRLAHRPGALLASLEPFAKHKVNLLKIESRPIHGKPFEYQFYVDVEAEQSEQLTRALQEVGAATSELRVLGLYAAAKR